jgi:uncharacterized membrane protein
MSTGSFSVTRAPQLRAKYFIFAFIGLMFAYVLRHNEHFLIDPKDPAWEHYQHSKWWLLPHGLTGACALILGPLQFSDRLRKRFTKFHRVIGRFYIAGVFCAAPLGTYIQYIDEHLGSARTFSFAAAADATLWITTTAVALAFILKGNVQQHRHWMIRSYAVAIVFLEVRVVAGITGWENLGDRVSEAIVWGCISFSLLFADIIINWPELRRSRPVPVRASSAAD